jgi:hypothetical protein
MNAPTYDGIAGLVHHPRSPARDAVPSRLSSGRYGRHSDARSGFH